MLMLFVATDRNKEGSLLKEKLLIICDCLELVEWNSGTEYWNDLYPTAKLDGDLITSISPSAKC